MSDHLHDAERPAKSDMTPMIDAVFLLIVFFLCIEFRVLEAKLPTYLPKDLGSSQQLSPPQPELSVAIVLDERGTETRRGEGPGIALTGHRVHWQLGPQRFDDLEALGAELAGIATDPARMVADGELPQQRRLMTVVVSPKAGTTYGDVATTVDAVTRAGFDQIRFAPAARIH